MVEIIRYETVHGIVSGLAGDLSQLCAKYGLKNVCVEELDPDSISHACKKASYIRQWRTHLRLKSVQLMPWANKITYLWYELPYNLARGMLMKELGLLVTKCSRPHQMLARNMASKDDRSCLWSHLGCNGRDDYEHLISGSCEFYFTKLKETGDPVRAEAEFIHNISMERTREFLQPLVLYGGYEEEFRDEVLEDPNIKIDNGMADAVIRDMIVRGDRGAETPEMVKSVSEGPERLERIAINKIKAMCGSDLPEEVIKQIPEPGNRVWDTQTAASPVSCVLGTTRILLGGIKGAQIHRAPTWPNFLCSLSLAAVMETGRIQNSKQYQPPNELSNISFVTMGNVVTVHINNMPVAQAPGPAEVTRVRSVIVGEDTLNTETVSRVVRQDTNRSRTTFLTIRKRTLVTEEHEIALRVKSERTTAKVSRGASRASTSRKKSREDASNMSGSEYDADNEEDPVLPNLALATALNNVAEGCKPEDPGEPASTEVPDTPAGSQEDKEQ